MTDFYGKKDKYYELDDLFGTVEDTLAISIM